MQMEIAYADIVLLNDELRRKNLRYRVGLKDAQTGYVEPPSACCLSAPLESDAYACMKSYFCRRGLTVSFTADGLYFSVTHQTK